MAHNYSNGSFEIESIRLDAKIGIFAGDNVPDETVVINAPIGSRYYQTNNDVYMKTGAGDTASNWTLIDNTTTAFKTISVSGQSDIVADASSDTLTVVAGSNVTLTTDATTDTLTISSTSTSTDKVYLTFGNNSPSEGTIPSINNTNLGYLMPTSRTLTSISVLTDVSNSNSYIIKKDGVAVETVVFDAQTSKIVTGISDTFTANTTMTVELSTPGSDINSAYTPDADTCFLAHIDGDSATTRHVTNSSTIATGMSGRLIGTTWAGSGAFSGSTESVSFDGNDYIELLHHNDYDTQDCTVELWFKPDVVNTEQYMFSKDSGGFDTGGHLVIGLTSAGKLWVRSQSSSYRHIFTGTTTLSASTWYHVAVVLGTGGFKVYLDGIEKNSNASWTQGLNGNREPCAVGASLRNNGDSYYSNVEHKFHGDIDELRISNNRRYASNFSVQTTEFTTDANTLGLWHFNEGSGNVAYDSSNTIHNAMIQSTGSMPSIDSVTKKIGTHSIKMNNSTGDWLRMNHTPVYECTAVTVEGWSYEFTDSTNGYIFQKGDSSTEGGLHIKWIDNGNKLQVDYWGATTSTQVTTTTNSFNNNEWHHFAITFDASNLKVYIDGTEVISESLTADFSNVWTNNKEDMYWAMKSDRTNFHQAYLDELRISNVTRTYSAGVLIDEVTVVTELE